MKAVLLSQVSIYRQKQNSKRASFMNSLVILHLHWKFSHSKMGVVVFNYAFNLHFLIINGVEHLHMFICPYSPSIYFLWWVFIQIFCSVCGQSFLFRVFLGPHSLHAEVLRLGVKLELQLPAYTTATATRDPSDICDPHHSLQQHQVLNSLREARDQTCIIMDTSRIINPLSYSGNSHLGIFLTVFFNNQEV